MPDAATPPPASTTTPATALSFDNMVPVRQAGKDNDQFRITVGGSAFADAAGVSVIFDTGSVTLSVPYESLSTDPELVTIVERDVLDPWQNPAHKVSGTISVKSTDGKTTYTLTDYVFFAVKDASKMRIMGAFPVPGSVPYELAEQHDPTNLGFGIASDADNSYLFLGATNSAIPADTLWRTDIPLWRTGQDFAPDAVPGFTVQLTFAGIDTPVQVPNVMATIDTGAPPMALRLNRGDPQLSAPYAAHFVPDTNWATTDMSGNAPTARTIGGDADCTVTVQFEDSTRKKACYSFPANEQHADSAWSSAVTVGTWTGGVPWPGNRPDKSNNRINLGNTVYRHCPVFVYDIGDKRVGISLPVTPAVAPIALATTSFGFGRGWMVTQGDY